MGQTGLRDHRGRQARAAQRALTKGESVLLIGTDCPALDRHRLIAAAQALDHHDCCLIPAHDGGYTLLGLNRYHRSLFERIPWSTGAVTDITRARIAALDWSLIEFPAMQDIDEPTVLAWLPEGWYDADQARSRPISTRPLSTEAINRRRRNQ